MVVVPAATPVTMPVLVTVAKVLLLLLQVPPVAGCDSVTVAPTHTAVGPLILPATATFIVTAVLVVPHALVTV